MSRKASMKIVKDICDEIAEELDFELVDVEFIKEFGDFYLRVYLDKKGGITLDDCQRASELISEVLDKKDPIEQSYYLEVSSPGLDRPLKTDKDLNRNLGKDVEIRLYAPLDGQKNYEGKLESFDDDNITIVMENGDTINIPRDTVSLVRLAIKF